MGVNAIHPIGTMLALVGKVTCAAIFPNISSREASDIVFTPRGRSLSANPSNGFMRIKLISENVKVSTMTPIDKQECHHQSSTYYPSCSPPCHFHGIGSRASCRVDSPVSGSTLHSTYKCTALVAEHHVPTTA
ncbi:hypothetical protein J3E69DRAFT_338766 [Trichoderma sp. SZMC 28015]